MDHPFILPLRGVAQDKRIVYMFIDYMPCGDLMGILTKFQNLPLDHAVFYAAQIVSAFDYLHSKEYIFRDLKPENVLVRNDGFL